MADQQVRLWRDIPYRERPWVVYEAVRKLQPLADVPALKEGEYDLANISLIGFDPVSGRSFEECLEEYKQSLTTLDAQFRTLRWWEFRRRWRLMQEVAILRQRLGTYGQ